MPRYTFTNPKDKTGKVFELTMSYEEYVQYVKDNPHLEQVFSPPGIADPIRVGQKKPDGWFRDRLKEIKKGNRGSTIQTW
jgi:hypothetical protein